MTDTCTEWIDAGYTLIAANRRLARRLQYNDARRRLLRGQTAWPSPDILSWQAWLQRCWDHLVQGHAQRLLLNEWQEQALWQRVINGSSRADVLLQTSNMVPRVMEAWGLMRQYRLPVFPENTPLNEDARAFREWAAGFREICSANQWCDMASVADVLEEYMDGDARIALIGFDRITPQQQHLFEHIARQGGRVDTTQSVPDVDKSRVCICPCTDSNDEIRAAAGWARALLENRPDARIGVVFPDLQQRRGDIERLFDDGFYPGALAAGTPSPPRPFSLSLGKPLLDYPLVNCAFSLLALGREALSVEEWGALLRSPWLNGAGEEACSRARLDACLRDDGGTRADAASLIRLAERRLPQEQRPRVLLSRFRDGVEYLQGLPNQARPDQWAGYLSRLLQVFGWPGERSLASDDYQVIQAWRDLLDRLVSLQLIHGRLSYAQSLGYLRRMAATRHFQPETGETPVQILGTAGAADMGFDHLWIAGLQEESWPAPARPNPFIPHSLQRQRDMPGATAEAALAEARYTLLRLAGGADDVVLSYPENEHDRTLRPSPLLKPFGGNREPPETPAQPDYAARILAAGRLETFTDERAPPLSGNGPVPGGTALFRDQSVCPFRAFARHRLHAGALEEVDIGLGPRERGLILHRVLHLLWQRLQSRDRLLALEAGALETLLASTVDEVIEALAKQHPRIWTPRFTELEKSRLVNTLRDWLQQERQRAPFTVIAGEESRLVNIEGIEVNTRIDRVDRLPDGREVIIDYKTGAAGVKAWMGERPDDPQLPLYAVTRDAEVAAVAFGRLKRGREFGYQGLASEEGILPATGAFSDSRQARELISDTAPEPDWEDLLMNWRQVVTRLARDFLDGDARVDPKNAEACRYCDQHPLCRIHERPAGSDDDDE